MNSSVPVPTQVSTGESLSKFFQIQCGNGVTIKYRKEDNYIHATGMCKAYNKLFGHWWRQKSTQAFVKALSQLMRFPVRTLVCKNVGGSGDDMGTWVHPDVAVYLAMWLDNLLAIRVIQWNRKIMTGDLTLVQELVQVHSELYNRNVKSTITSVPENTLTESELGRIHIHHAGEVQKLRDSLVLINARHTQLQHTALLRVERLKDQLDQATQHVGVLCHRVKQQQTLLTQLIQTQQVKQTDIGTLHAQVHRQRTLLASAAQLADQSGPAVVYAIRCNGSGYVKVGYSYHLPQRLRSLQTANPHQLVVEYTTPTDHPVALESAIHKDLKTKSDCHVHGEWFRVSTSIDWQQLMNRNRVILTQPM
jgi:hypothetical protein